MSDVEYRTHFSQWAILAAPLIAGNDLRSMNAETRQILLNKEVIAVNQDRLGKAGYRVAKDGDTEVWAKPLDQGARAVARGPLNVRDLWAHTDRGRVANFFAADVASHWCRTDSRLAEYRGRCERRPRAWVVKKG